jgi:hypothetical protein
VLGIELDKQPPFIVTITSNFSPIIQRIQKRSRLLNELFKNHDVPFYLEVVTNGFLLIMEDFKAFLKFRNADMLKRQMEKINKKKTNLGKDFIQFLSGQAFPQEGIFFECRSDTISAKELFPIINENFNSIHKEIFTELMPPNKIIVHFKSLDSFRYYSLITIMFTSELEDLVFNKT